MKVLILTHNYLQGYGGGAFGARAYINAFAALYDDVTLLFPARREGEEAEAIDPRVKTVPVVDRRSLPKKVWDIGVRGILHRFEAAFLGLLVRERFDLVVFQNSKCSSRLIGPAKASGAKVIVIHDNYEVEYTRDNASLAERLLQMRAVRKTEEAAVRDADLNLVLTLQDKELLARHYARDRRAVLELWGSFEFAHREDLSWPEVTEPVFLITGNLGARQTEDSLFPWLDTCWPLLRQTVPSARLVVAGKNPSEPLRQRLAKEGAALVDTPPDMNAVLRQGKYFICPVCKGGGIKLRVMDGLRAGLPVLVHQVSARGYEVFRDSALFVYEDAASFGKALQKMLATPLERRSVQALFRTHFSLEAGISRLQTLLTSYGWI